MSNALDNTKKRNIHVPVTLDSATRKKDRSVKFAFTTMREISTEEFMVMDSFHQSAGHLLFAENAFNEEDIPDEDVEPDLEKSQSTQIRDAIWILYKVKGGNTGDKGAWNSFYRRQQQIYKARILDEVHKLENN